MKKNKYKKTLMFILFLLFLDIIGLLSYYIYVDCVGEAKYLDIRLNGDNEVTINYGEIYEDTGAKATYKNKDISKDIIIKNDLDYDHIGNYNYTYTIKYKKQEKNASRVINIVDSESPKIELNGNSEISIYVGDKYEEKGAIASDNYDGDLTEKLVISGEVDASKVGEYIINYKVFDSSNNEASIERKIKVKERPVQTNPSSNSSGPKVAVLNYHFFYETDEENNKLCGRQTICEKMSKFREQLQYLNDNGFKTLTMKEFVSWMYGEIELPQKSVLITIDDGALGTGKHNGNYLIPALEEYKINATLFLITGWWDINNYSSEYLDVESHTHDLHIRQNCSGFVSKVNCIDYDKLLSDLKQSIAVTNSTDAFCFPFYEYSDKSINAVQEAGFKVAFIGGNRKASRNDNKFKIPRYVIYDSTTLQQFINMVN